MIELEIGDGLARLVMNRPDAGNAMTSGMLERMAAAIAQAASSCSVLLVSGAGPDFTIGRDRTEAKSGTPFEAFSKIHGINRALAGFRGISIAAVRGRAYGFGTGLVIRCDLAVAADDARFCLDEVKLGFPPMFVMEEMLEHLAPKRAADLVLLSREIDAGEALAAGLLSRVVAPGEVEATADAMAAELLTRDPQVLSTCKRYMRAVHELPAEARGAYALVEQTRFAMQNH